MGHSALAPLRACAGGGAVRPFGTAWCIRGGARVVGLHGGVPGGVVESRFGARGGARHVAVMGHKLVCIIMLLLARHSW